MSRIKANLKDRDLSLTCKICGEPITHSNEYGMYCENKCGIEDDKKAKEKIEKIFKRFGM